MRHVQPGCHIMPDRLDTQPGCLSRETFGLEEEFKSDLHVARKVRLRGDVAEGGGAGYGVGEAELRTIHEVEGFEAELQTDGVVDFEVFDGGEIVFKGERGAERGCGAGHVTELECLAEAEGAALLK
jgi:hypothetical protein